MTAGLRRVVRAGDMAVNQGAFVEYDQDVHETAERHDVPRFTYAFEGDDLTNGDDHEYQEEFIHCQADFVKTAPDETGEAVGLLAAMGVDVAGQKQVEQIQQREGKVLLRQNDIPLKQHAVDFSFLNLG